MFKYHYSLERFISKFLLWYCIKRGVYIHKEKSSHLLETSLCVKQYVVIELLMDFNKLEQQAQSFLRMNDYYLEGSL